ncbi:uncharacterized protein LOC62_04G005388 [Vanrija pseudolonga]|uniref:Uncharacterized protein n=1 Tax=Vanrija pseudolonga TaxID=143232 RepID=A0AAF0Y7X8_9TREE|nr:hypothetical protein LOC62_04G005388 [Vanrija pseudolonga]
MNTDDALVQQLGELVHRSDQGNDGYADNLGKQAAILAQLAQDLREPSVRDHVGNSGLPLLLARILEKKPPTPRPEQYEGLLEQVGRAAANLAAETPSNVDRLATAHYPERLIDILGTDFGRCLRLEVLRPLVASLYNLAKGSTPAVSKALGTAQATSTLLSLGNHLYTPGVWAGDDHSTRAAIVGWIYDVIDEALPEKGAPAYSLSAKEVALFIPALEGAAPRKAPVDLEDITDSVGNSWEADANITTNAAAILERFAEADKIDPAVLQDKSASEGLFDFVQNAEVAPWLKTKVSAEEAEETEKALGTAKGSVAKAIVHLLSEAGDKIPDWVWARIRLWLSKNDREDLVSVALLAYGNRARSDAASEALLKEEFILPSLVALLVPSTPVRTQHSLVGLLRNLSIPAKNKKILGDAGVIEGVLNLNPWVEQRDIVGSVQGGAIGVIKNLVREAPNAVRFFAAPNGLDPLLALLKRTDDPAIALEGDRVLAASTRSLSDSSALAGADKAVTAAVEPARAKLTSPEIVGALNRFLISGAKYPVLLNEAVVALALQAAIGDKAEVASALLAKHHVKGASKDVHERFEELDGSAIEAAEGQVDVEVGDKNTTRGVDVVAAVIAPAEAGPSGEIQANAVTLVAHLGSSEVNEVIKAAVKAAKLQGNAVADTLTVLLPSLTL